MPPWLWTAAGVLLLLHLSRAAIKHIITVNRAENCHSINLAGRDTLDIYYYGTDLDPSVCVIAILRSSTTQNICITIKRAQLDNCVSNRHLVSSFKMKFFDWSDRNPVKTYGCKYADPHVRDEWCTVADNAVVKLQGQYARQTRIHLHAFIESAVPVTDRVPETDLVPETEESADGEFGSVYWFIGGVGVASFLILIGIGFIYHRCRRRNSRDRNTQDARHEGTVARTPSPSRQPPVQQYPFQPLQPATDYDPPPYPQCQPHDKLQPSAPPEELDMDIEEPPPAYPGY